MTSNTGCVSVTDPLITRSTSEVAVWRSSACCVSVKRRTFSMAITAWSTKDSASDTSRASKAPARSRHSTSTPVHWSARSIGSMSDVLSPWVLKTSLSCGGRSMAVQSGICSAVLLVITREGKFDTGSMATLR